MSPDDQGFQRHRDRPRPADLNDAVDTAAIGQLAHLRVPTGCLGVVDHFRAPSALRPSAFAAVEVVAITRAPKT